MVRSYIKTQADSSLRSSYVACFYMLYKGAHQSPQSSQLYLKKAVSKPCCQIRRHLRPAWLLVNIFGQIFVIFRRILQKISNNSSEGLYLTRTYVGQFFSIALVQSGNSGCDLITDII